MCVGINIKIATFGVRSPNNNRKNTSNTDRFPGPYVWAPNKGNLLLVQVKLGCPLN